MEVFRGRHDESRAFPALDDATLIGAHRDAYALHRATAVVAGLVWDHKLSKIDALQQLARECPGFPVLLTKTL